MVAMVFTENKEIPPITIDENASSSMTSSDQQRFFRAHCSYLKFMQFIDEVPEAEQQRKRQEEEHKEKVECFPSIIICCVSIDIYSGFNPLSARIFTDFRL